MSNAVSAMQGASFKGSLHVQDAGLQGMITLRGDLNADALISAVKSVTGADMPGIGKIRSGKKGATAWMSPDELLLLVGHDQADAIVAKLDTALSGTHVLAVNVSDARAMFTLEGPVIRDVLAKGAPANLSEGAFHIGDIRRTRLGQVAVAFWLSSEKTASVVCFRSVGEHVFNWLKSAAQNGTTPKYYSK
ncbi:MAG: sarcosine oxidase subunit gamma family protein [Rhodobacterales bacterium]